MEKDYLIEDAPSTEVGFAARYAKDALKVAEQFTSRYESEDANVVNGLPVDEIRHSYVQAMEDPYTSDELEQHFDKALDYLQLEDDVVMERARGETVVYLNETDARQGAEEYSDDSVIPEEAQLLEGTPEDAQRIGAAGDHTEFTGREDEAAEYGEEMWANTEAEL